MIFLSYYRLNLVHAEIFHPILHYIINLHQLEPIIHEACHENYLLFLQINLFFWLILSLYKDPFNLVIQEMILAEEIYFLV